MPGMDYGLERGFGMIVETVVVALLISELVPLLVEQGMLPSGIFWWVIPVSIVSAVMTVDASRYWSFGYLAGVCIGIYLAIPIFLEAGLLSTLDILIYGGLALAAVGLRVKIHSSGF
ncbi:hypothetical protein [Halogeometricum luteum]|uniref:SPW repeat-containing protein n=1 Tax=Halogeometricum luteum TaxID=2950537 RepID=A0ABU2G8M8_9EURY|nr:hypothetical protein [Halogeometricum sp. S3BR5-2]MDS0296608.1 hypothetical protein [Halogeometricum sp. S3BR5-2]